LIPSRKSLPKRGYSCEVYVFITKDTHFVAHRHGFIENMFYHGSRDITGIFIFLSKNRRLLVVTGRQSTLPGLWHILASFGPPGFTPAPSAFQFLWSVPHHLAAKAAPAVMGLTAGIRRLISALEMGSGFPGQWPQGTFS
jgi:hypothetical protein